MDQPLNFSSRDDLEEEMDSVHSFELYQICLHQLSSVSRLVLAHRPTLRFLNRLADAHPARPLHILDVACGDGSMLRRVADWAIRRRLKVHLTGLDLNPRAIQVARDFAASAVPIEYVVSDVFAYSPQQTPDVILSAHFTHHLPGPMLVRFLRWMEDTARLGWFVNDLHRHRNPYRLFRLLAVLKRWHPIIVSDGLISIRRAFTPADWQMLLSAAEIPAAELQQEFPARLTVTHLK